MCGRPCTRARHASLELFPAEPCGLRFARNDALVEKARARELLWRQPDEQYAVLQQIDLVEMNCQGLRQVATERIHDRRRRVARGHAQDFDSSGVIENQQLKAMVMRSPSPSNGFTSVSYTHL